MDFKGAFFASKSHFWTPLLVFLCILLLGVCSSLAQTLSQVKFHTIDVEAFRLKNGRDVSKCKGQQLERSNPERSENVEGGVTIGLNHIHGTCSPLRPRDSSWSQIVLERLEGDKSRVNAIKSRIAANVNDGGERVNLPLQSGIKYNTGNYIVSAGFGTPVNNFLLTIDTGSDLSWMQCQPCLKPNRCYKQVNPIFNPRQSSSYKRLKCHSRECDFLVEATGNPTSCSPKIGTCVYEIRYGDGSITDGDLSKETLKLGPDSFSNFSFGCAHSSNGTFDPIAGILGLGRNPLSLPSQTKSRYGGQFSYCLPDFTSAEASGVLNLGRGSIPSSAIFTPLLLNRAAPSFYFLGLTDISVGRERLHLKPGLFTPTPDVGGVIIDSGTVITRLIAPAYDALKASFRKQTRHLRSAQLPIDLLDTCYNLTGQTHVSVPGITFHFQGNSEVAVNSLGILAPVAEGGNYACLAFASTLGDLSIIGNFQQQRLRVAYDTPTKRIGFSPRSCGN
eukprot:Gb_20896 [translate_table: standard]